MFTGRDTDGRFTGQGRTSYFSMRMLPETRLSLEQNSARYGMTMTQFVEKLLQHHEVGLQAAKQKKGRRKRGDVMTG